MRDAWVAFTELEKEFAVGKVKSGDVFGTREFLKNNYLYHMAAAVLGIYGNSKQEAMYPMYWWMRRSRSWKGRIVTRCASRRVNCLRSTRSGR